MCSQPNLRLKGTACRRGGCMKHVRDAEQRAIKNIQDSLNVKRALLDDHGFLALLAEVGHRMADAIGQGNRVFYFGNGGSAADAQHLGAELTGRYLRERPGLPGIALTVNTSAITAIANGYSYEMVFARQLES